MFSSLYFYVFISQKKNLKRAICIDGEFLIMGGYQSGKGDLIQSEKCTLYNRKIVCTKQGPELEEYYWWPELFAVENDYCKTLP